MQINPDNVPNHIAIIMDGNNRFAKSKLLPRVLGHKMGAQNAKKIALACKEYGVKYLTLYAFSSENWGRPQGEVEDLMRLLKNYLQTDLKELVHSGIKIKFIGERKKLDNEIQVLIKDIEEASNANNIMTLIIALSYGALEEVDEAAKQMAIYAANNLIDVNTLSIRDFLQTKGIPDPDLLIRTGGDHRVSNFLLLQIAYTEIYFCDIFWPSFDKTELYKALQYYQLCERRFGKR